MAFLKEPYLLSIAIPTYNRSGYLDEALKHIFLQVQNREYALEILVSDNCSTDDTTAVVEKYILAGLPIRYLKNKENKGADFNIAQCYLEAKGAYVLAFGDDDILLNGSLDRIFTVLKQYPNFGILYLNWTLNTGQNQMDINAELWRFDDVEEFFKQVNHNITFISGNIVNARFIKEIPFEKYYSCNLVQLPLFLTAAFTSPYNLMLPAAIVAVPSDNSGGYSVCTVFGKHINQIFEEFSVNDKQIRIFKMLNNSLLTSSFPAWIRRIKTSKHTFTDGDIHQSLYPVFKNYIAYWLLDYPLIIQPQALFKYTWPVFILYAGVLRRVMPSFRINKGIHTTLHL